MRPPLAARSLPVKLPWVVLIARQHPKFIQEQCYTQSTQDVCKRMGFSGVSPLHEGQPWVDRGYFLLFPALTASFT